jgi:hypothetical protein
MTMKFTPPGKFCNPRHVAGHRQLDEAEPKRRRHLDLGGGDANGDQGRDKMPDSSQGVRPLKSRASPTGCRDALAQTIFRARKPAIALSS